MSNVMEIRSRWDNKVLFSVEADTLKEAVLSAIKAGADLYGADLRSADLRSANLGGARNLPQNALAPYRDDIRQILGSSPTEVGGLLQALRDGKVDGSTYTGECACLVGTIAKVRGVSYDAIPGLRPDSSRPAEQWFTNIRASTEPRPVGRGESSRRTTAIFQALNKGCERWRSPAPPDARALGAPPLFALQPVEFSTTRGHASDCGGSATAAPLEARTLAHLERPLPGCPPLAASTKTRATSTVAAATGVAPYTTIACRSGATYTFPIDRIDVLPRPSTGPTSTKSTWSSASLITALRAARSSTSSR